MIEGTIMHMNVLINDVHITIQDCGIPGFASGGNTNREHAVHI